MRLFILLGTTLATAFAGTILYGTEDCLTTGCYGASDPTAGATLQGLTAGTMTSATTSFGHGYPFTPTAGDFAGTDQIYVGDAQSASLDGYSSYSGRLESPDVLTMDYSSLVGPGQTVATFTLGLALDDFQAAAFGQLFTISINGVANAAITNFVNTLNETGPVVQFFTFGIDPSGLAGTNVLTVQIDEGGNGGDGYAIDFATVGVTTTNALVPEPGTSGLLAIGLVMAGLRRRRKIR
jgi:hypothetical protein